MAFDVYLASGGPILLGVLIALSTALKWPSWVNYIWAAVTIIWGIVALV